MGNADAGDVDARLQQRLQDVKQREQTARQAHTQKRAEVSAKLQRMSDIEQWGKQKYGAHRFSWVRHREEDYEQMKAYAEMLGVDTSHDQLGQGFEIKTQDGGHCHHFLASYCIGSPV